METTNKTTNMEKINALLSQYFGAQATANDEFAKHIETAFEKARDAFWALEELKKALEAGNLAEAMEIIENIDDGEYNLDKLMDMVGVGLVSVEAQAAAVEVVGAGDGEAREDITGEYELHPILRELVKNPNARYETE